MKTVSSPDGTVIAFDQSGAGPNLVLVHGTAGTRARWAPIRAGLEPHFVVTAIDRRGRGDSGDSAKYAFDREIEDVVALADSLDGPVILFGHSYGAMVALEAAMRTNAIRGLVLYEPPIVDEGENIYAQEMLERMEQSLAGGDRSAVVEILMREVVRVPMEQLEILKASPVWPARAAAAHTIPRELRTQDAYRLDTRRAAQLKTPVLLLLGGDSPLPFRRAIARLEKTLPESRTIVMAGQQHVAMDTAPDLVISAVLKFGNSLGSPHNRQVSSLSATAEAAPRPQLHLADPSVSGAHSAS